MSGKSCWLIASRQEGCAEVSAGNDCIHLHFMLCDQKQHGFPDKSGCRMQYDFCQPSHGSFPQCATVSSHREVSRNMGVVPCLLDSCPCHWWPGHTPYLGSCWGFALALALLFSSWLAFLSSCLLGSSRCCLLLSLLQEQMPMLQAHDLQVDIEHHSITHQQCQLSIQGQSVCKTASVA